jgi:hypothetical protein
MFLLRRHIICVLRLRCASASFAFAAASFAFGPDLAAALVHACAFFGCVCVCVLRLRLVSCVLRYASRVCVFSAQHSFAASSHQRLNMYDSMATSSRGRAQEHHHYRRSPSPRPQRSSRRRSASPPRHAASSRDFFRGTGSSSARVCAVCLGRHETTKIRFTECEATRTWDGAHRTLSRRNSRKELVSISSGLPLCVDWQRERGCNVGRHAERHRCSGCDSTGHGASSCPRAEKI